MYHRAYQRERDDKFWKWKELEKSEKLQFYLKEFPGGTAIENYRNIRDNNWNFQELKKYLSINMEEVSSKLNIILNKQNNKIHI